MVRTDIAQLTVTRFIAAIAVVIFHYGQAAIPFDAGIRHEIASEAGITVSYFFFLSGFLLYHVYRAKQFNARRFFTARVARIVPLYWFSFILALFGVLFLLGQKPWGGTAVMQALFVQAWFPGNSLTINYPAWSVSVEVFFYLSFPFLLLLVQKVGQRKFLVLASILWLISLLQNLYVQKEFYDPASNEAGDFIMYFPLWHLNTFVCGIAASIVFANMFLRKWNAVVLLSAIVIGLCFVLLIITSDGFFHSIMHSGFLSPFYALIVIGLSMDKSWLAAILSWKPLVFLGEISYGIYLLQYPVWIGFRSFAPEFNISSTYGFYTYLIVLIVVSAIVYQFLESPLRRIIRNRFDSPAPEKV